MAFFIGGYEDKLELIEGGNCTDHYWAIKCPTLFKNSIRFISKEDQDCMFGILERELGLNRVKEIRQ